MDQQQITKSIKQYSQLASAKGCLKGVQPGVYTPINLALYPFESTRQFSDHITQLQIIYQKLIHLASEDDQLIQEILKSSKGGDEWINFLETIYFQSKNSKRSDALTFCRIDYLLNSDFDPKLIQYNLVTVGMSYNNKIINECQKIFNQSQQHLYFENNAIDMLIDSVIQHYTEKKLTGTFLMLISRNQLSCMFEQRYILDQLSKAGIRSKSTNLRQLLDHGRKDQKNNLYFQEKLVSFVYFYTGFLPKQYEIIIGFPEEAVKARVFIETSNVTCVPSIRMYIINTKIAQVYLTKGPNLRKYLTEEESQKIEKTIVQNYNIADISEELYTSLLQRIEDHPQNWVLKPNMQGGGNNFYNKDILPILQPLKIPSQRRFVLMQKIRNNPLYDNYVINQETLLHKIRCTYQIGRYGIISMIDGKLSRNTANGSYVKTRLVNSDYSSSRNEKDGVASWRMLKQKPEKQ